MLSRVVSTFLCWRANECPWPRVAGALILCAVRVTRLARGRDSPTLCGFRSLITRAVKRGADACTVGDDAYVAALETEVWVFCFPTVACGVVGKECGAQITLEHNVQRNGFSCFLVVAVISGFLVRIGLFNPCGCDLLTVVDGVSCAERDAAAGSGFLGAGVLTACAYSHEWVPVVMVAPLFTLAGGLLYASQKRGN